MPLDHMDTCVVALFCMQIPFSLADLFIRAYMSSMTLSYLGLRVLLRNKPMFSLAPFQVLESSNANMNLDEVKGKLQSLIPKCRINMEVLC